MKATPLGQVRLRHAATLLLAACIGLLAAVGAVWFRVLIAWFQGLIWGGGEDLAHLAARAPWWLVLAAPALAGLVTGPVTSFLAPEARGPGVSEVIKAVARNHSIIRHRVTAVKALVTSLLIGAGASVGREGPVVQIGASMGSSLSQALKLGAETRRTLLAAGAAAGIAATFNAPIAGTMFAVEIILLDMNVSAITHILVAAVSGSALSRLMWGDLPSLAAGGFGLNSAWELAAFLVLGVLAGCTAMVFVRLLFGLDRAFAKLPVPGWATPALGGLLMGFIALMLPQVMGVGYGTVNQAMAGNLALGLAAAVLGGKLLATALCIGSGMSGGVFAPSLVLGASLGAAASLGANALFPGLHLVPGHYALAGMGAVVAGTTLAPLTAILTIFELTHSYRVILPVMIACIAGAGTARLFLGYSAYERKLLAQGLNIVRGHDLAVLRSISVREVMSEAYATLAMDSSLDAVLAKVINEPYPHFLVVDRRGRPAGMLSARDLRPALDRMDDLRDVVIAADMMTARIVTVSAAANLEAAMALFDRHPVSCMPVTDADGSGRIVGVLKRQDLMHAYQERLFKDRMLSLPLR